MKEELSNALGELNGLIFKGLREDNPDNKMVHAMNISLQLVYIRMMFERNCAPPVNSHQLNIIMK
jgi:hypothetical protein